MIEIKLYKDIDKNYDLITSKLKLKKSFDLLKREILIGERKSYFFFVDGLIDDDFMEKILSRCLSIKKEEINATKNTTNFINKFKAHIEIEKENEINKIISNILTGFVAILIDGFDEAIILDIHSYPHREIEEPTKEQSLKGSKDGFVETLTTNTALIRRRIHNENLIFESLNIGNKSKTKVVIGYLDGLAYPDEIKLIKDKLNSINVRSLTMGDQSLVETLTKSKWYNPFPKIKTTQRPDVASSHILEGKIVLIIDNSPNIIILPVSIFDFMQEVDDYYQPIITGNYLRFIRNFTLLYTLILTPLYLLLIEYLDMLPTWIQFIKPDTNYAVPLAIQFLLLEIAVDSLKLASLNTPGALGMSLSVVGALILGDFAVQTQWFIPDTILYMSIVALGGFAQSSVELGFAIKLCRVLLLILTAIFDIWGFIIGLILILLLISTNKTITGKSYIYPIYPFNKNALIYLLFRMPIKLNIKQ